MLHAVICYGVLSLMGMPGMFEALETGKSIKGSDFTKLRDALRPQLIQAQLDHRTRPCNFVELLPRLNEA